MAIAYTGPRAQTYSLTINDNGVKKNIYLETKMVQLQPTLKQTNILNLIRNTNGVGMFNDNSNTRYYYNIKEEGDLDIIMDAEGAKIDPRTIDASDMSILAKQLAPITRVKKFKGFKSDLKIQGLENVVATKMADYIAQVRLSDQAAMFKQTIASAADFQRNNLDAYTTFDEGAHYVYGKEFADGNEAHDHLCEAIDNFQRLGSSTAAQDINKKIPHCNGVPLSDMVIIASNAFTTKLKKVPGVFAGPMGNELFMKNGIDMVEGVPYIATSQLPKNIHFIITTTGVHGAIAYEECGNISQEIISGKSESVMNHNIVMVDDPNYSGCYRIDYTNMIKKDILFDDLIFVSSNEKTLPTKTRGIKTQVRDATINVDEVNTLIASYKQKLEGAENNIKALDEKITKVQTSLKEGGKNIDRETIKKELEGLKAKYKSENSLKDEIEKSIKNWNKAIGKLKD